MPARLGLHCVPVARQQVRECLAGEQLGTGLRARDRLSLRGIKLVSPSRIHRSASGLTEIASGSRRMTGPADLRLPIAVPLADGGHRLSSQLGPADAEELVRCSR
jgi:hypothetical protein